MTAEPKYPVPARERDEWLSLVKTSPDIYEQLPSEALIASIKHLAGRLLEITYGA